VRAAEKSNDHAAVYRHACELARLIEDEMNAPGTPLPLWMSMQEMHLDCIGRIATARRRCASNSPVPYPPVLPVPCRPMQI
jgi:hypothetical protein